MNPQGAKMMRSYAYCNPVPDRATQGCQLANLFSGFLSDAGVASVTDPAVPEL